MRRKLVVGIMLISLSSAGFAMQITKGKLISHKEWTTGNNIVAQIKDVNPSKKFFNQAITHHSQNITDGINIVDRMNQDISGVAGSPISAEGSSDTYIFNNTTSPQTYTITTQVCAQPQEAGLPYPCATNEDTLILDPSGSISLNRYAKLNLTYDKPGFYQTGIQTFVIKDNQSTMYGSDSVDIIRVTEQA